MAETPNDCGPAFPAAWGNPEQGGDYVPGMSLRDWFAGQALAGFASDHEQPIEKHEGETDKAALARHWATTATAAYIAADAMLAARTPETQGGK